MQLDPAEYDRLEAEAKRRGVTPGSLASEFVRAGLGEKSRTTTEERRRAALEALDRLDRLTADLPTVDAVRIARESREELERRPLL